MNTYFDKFIENITLTSTQTNDAKTKYTGVCEVLHRNYYSGNYNDGNKYLFGSYKTKTNIRPLSPDQDVDVLFKIPKQTFERFNNYATNGQEALLQEVRGLLKEHYTTTDTIKAWGKVVLVQFAEGHHNVELLPAFEQKDGTFLIPNTENGGTWERFDPRSEVENFDQSNSSSNGLTRNLAKILKSWAHNTSSMHYPSYKRLNDIINFIADYYPDGMGDNKYQKVIFDYFDYMLSRCDDEIKSYIQTAYNRAQKALGFIDDDKFKEASEEYIKIFGDKFPKVSSNPEKRSADYISTNPIRPWYSSQIKK